MKIITWNVNSIRTRLERLLGVLERHEPDVVCLQELKCPEDELPLLELRGAGYHAAAHAQKTYNGVAILTRDEPADVVRGFDDGAAEDEQARLVSATLGGVRIISAYFPNGRSVGSDKWDYKLKWMARLRGALERRAAPTDPLVLAGDFNVALDDKDVANPEKWADSVLYHPDVRAALDGVASWGLRDVVRPHHPEGGVYSWWDYRRLAFPKGDGLRIDHVFATEPMAARCIGARVDRDERKGKQPSDHAPVIAEFESPPGGPATLAP